MMRKRTCALLALGLAAGCGATGIPYCGDEELHASIAPAAVPPASPGFLGLLPAKKGEPIDPGEITDKRDFHGFVRFDLYVMYPAVGAGCRWGVDRAHPTGIELHGGFVRVSDLEVATSVAVVGASFLFALGSSDAFLGVRVDGMWEPAVRVPTMFVGADVVKALAGRWEIGCGAIFPVTVDEEGEGPPPVLPWVGVGVRF